MNYRHAFHAGNFADLVKHAALLALLERLTAEPGPLLVVDTHAGAGAYDLQGEMARRSAEAEAGIGRLMAEARAPAAFDSLKAAVARANPGSLRTYPGSPALAASRLRPGDAYLGAELRPDDFALLTQSLAGSPGEARAVQEDGYALLERTARDPRRLLVLIDPPFERADDYGRMLQALAPVLQRRAPASVLAWLPLKDLETFDSFLRGLEALEPPSALVVEARLNRLADPMRMNGCALVLLSPPEGLEATLAAAADWVARACGGEGARAKLWRLT